MSAAGRRKPRHGARCLWVRECRGNGSCAADVAAGKEIVAGDSETVAAGKKIVAAAEAEIVAVETEAVAAGAVTVASAVAALSWCHCAHACMSHGPYQALAGLQQTEAESHE